MNTFDMSTSSASAEWLIFVAILLAIGIGVACFAIWLFVLRGSGKKHSKRRKRRRHHRQINPTLAQTGGLPPPRNPNEPPRGV
jgi:hypothetical protein